MIHNTSSGGTVCCGDFVAGGTAVAVHPLCLSSTWTCWLVMLESLFRSEGKFIEYVHCTLLRGRMYFGLNNVHPRRSRDFPWPRLILRKAGMCIMQPGTSWIEAVFGHHQSIHRYASEKTSLTIGIDIVEINSFLLIMYVFRESGNHDLKSPLKVPTSAQSKSQLWSLAALHAWDSLPKVYYIKYRVIFLTGTPLKITSMGKTKLNWDPP